MVPVESVMLTTVHFATTLSFPSSLLSPFHVPARSAAVSFAGAGAGAAAGAAIADVVSAFGGSALVHAVKMTATNSNFRIWSSRWGRSCGRAQTDRRGRNLHREGACHGAGSLGEGRGGGDRRRPVRRDGLAGSDTC